MVKRGFVDDISDEYSEDKNKMAGVFEFEFQKSGFPKNWKNVVNKQRYRTTLRHKRNPRRGDDLGREMRCT